MKYNKKYIINLFLILSLLTTTANTAFSIENKKAKKQAKQESIQVKPEYTNDIHSVFTLMDCVNVALKYNPSIRSYVYSEDIYKSKIGQAWASYFPSISAGVDLSRSGNRYYRGTPYGYRSMYNTMGYVPKISADMLLFDFGKTKANADSAKRMYEAKQADTKENINSIIYDIKVTYYNILFAQAQVKVYEDTVLDYELQLSQAWGFYNLGKKAKIDVVTAEYNLGKARLNLVKARNTLEVAYVELSKIMGIPEYKNYELADELSLNRFDINVEDAIKTAFEVRPELISAQKNVDAAKMNLRAQRRNFTPDLGVYASFEYGIGNDYNIRSTQVGAGLNYNTFNIALTKKEIDQARAEYKKAVADFEDTKDTVYYNVKKDYMNLETTAEEIRIAKLALDQAKEQYRQVTGRYKAGVGDAIELKDGENTYLNARLDFYEAMLNYNIAAASLEKEIGIPLKLTDKSVLDNTSL